MNKKWREKARKWKTYGTLTKLKSKQKKTQNLNLFSTFYFKNKTSPVTAQFIMGCFYFVEILLDSKFLLQIKLLFLLLAYVYG